MRLFVLLILLVAFDAQAQDCASLFPDKQPQCPDRIRGGCYGCWSQQYRSCAPVSPAETCSGGSVPCTRTGRPDGPTIQYPASYIPQREIRTYNADHTEVLSIEWTCEASPKPVPSPLRWTSVSQPCPGVWLSYPQPNPVPGTRQETTIIHSCQQSSRPLPPVIVTTHVSEAK